MSDPLEIETEVAGAIAELNPTLHRPTLRALLRRERLDSSAVASLLELLDLPGVVAKTLSARDAAEGVSGSELVPKTTPREATVSAIRADWADRKRIRNRPLYLAYAVGTALAAVVCLAMTGLGIAIWLTDGAVIDQAGVETEDRVFVGAFALLALILIPTAVYRLRRSRKSQDSE